MKLRESNFNVSEQNDAKVQVKQYGSYKAYLLITLSSIFLTFMQLNFKQLSRHFSPSYLLALRGIFSFVLNSLFINHMSLNPDIRNPRMFRMLVIRAILSFATVACYIGSLKNIPIGIANALHNTSPIITFFIQVFYYKKTKIHWINLIINISCFIGVIFIVQPQFIFGSSSSQKNENKIFYIMVLASAFLSSLSAIFMHDLSGKVHELIALQYGYVSQSIFNTLFFITFIGTTPKQQDFIHSVTWQQMGKLSLNFIFMIIFAVASQYTRTKSYFMCYPALVMPFNFLSIILGFCIDIFIFDSKSYNSAIIFGIILASFGLFSKFIILKMNKNPEANKK